MRIFCFLFCLSIAAAAVESPSIGYVRAADGSIVRVAGVSGAFVTTAAEQPQAVSAGFSGSLGDIIANQATYRLSGVLGASICVMALSAGVWIGLLALQRATTPKGVRASMVQASAGEHREEGL